MTEFVETSVFFGVAISLIGYEIGLWIRKKWKMTILNPLLISILFVMGFLSLFGIDYEIYYEGAKYISYLLTPATVCLAIPLYQQLELLAHHKVAILGGITAGVLASLTSVLGLSVVFGLTHEEYVTLLPKSITTAIGIGISEEAGGMVTITVAVIIITGVFGNIVAETVCRLFRIEDSVAKGIAIGTSSHAMGTTRAMEIGEIEGAMSSLSIVVAGLITVVGASVFVGFY